ncbi:MAG: 2-succinyl-6-hydroxy-2,4-cyclohexadiene-1-carboxylate synthase [bacterium]|nr:2-succinyl-6-hydroxy-2,4-cyclohexadiene-1-carboxylate synthase [bacterium]
MRHASPGGIEWNCEWRGRESKPLLALVHGFAGSLKSWDDLTRHLEQHFRLLLVDLPGHGGTPVPETAMTLRELGTTLGEFVRSVADGAAMMCGYSMGGRVTLHTALFSPEAVSALVLMGASPGIEDARERKERQASDQALAEKILANGIERFADYWGSLPLFASQNMLPPDMQAELRASRLACDPQGLAYCLKNFGTGEQEFLARKLHRLSCPVLLMAGALDENFSRLNHHMAASIGTPAVRVVEIPRAGHAAHIENPKAVAREILSFSENLRIES